METREPVEKNISQESVSEKKIIKKGAKNDLPDSLNGSRAIFPKNASH